MPSTWFYYRYPKPIVDKVARSFPKALPSIKTPVRTKPILIKHQFVKTPEGRLLTIGKHVTRLFREERIEMVDHRAHAVRPYAERATAYVHEWCRLTLGCTFICRNRILDGFPGTPKCVHGVLDKRLISNLRGEPVGFHSLMLIQLAIEYGDCHKPTMEVCNYYLHEKDLIHKLFKVFVPRYRNCSTAYTSIYQLPAFYGLNPERPDDEGAYVYYWPVVLEMKGNPYPPVVSKPEVHRNSLLNVLLDSARKQYALEKRQKSQQQEAAPSDKHKEPHCQEHIDHVSASEASAERTEKSDATTVS